MTAELHLPPNLRDEDSLPTGEGGFWDWLASVGGGELGVLTFAPGTTYEDLAAFFTVAAQASSLVIGAERATGRELALMTHRNMIRPEGENEKPAGASSCF